MNKADTQIYSVVNKSYLLLATEWASKVYATTGKSVLFSCADKESYAHLMKQSYACIDNSLPTELSSICTKVWPQSSFPSDHAAYTASLKFQTAVSILKSGQDCIYSDVDALWLKDPFPFLCALDFDMAFQVGSFPAAAKSLWGFSACSGFIAIHATSLATQALEKSILRLNGSDQVALNETLMNSYMINWYETPSNWEHCDLNNGWTSAITGQCQHTQLLLAALPHSLFQRHNTTIENCKHAIICHPNSPKNQNDKIRIMQSLKIWQTD